VERGQSRVAVMRQLPRGNRRGVGIVVEPTLVTGSCREDRKRDDADNESFEPDRAERGAGRLDVVS